MRNLMALLSLIPTLCFAQFVPLMVNTNTGQIYAAGDYSTNGIFTTLYISNLVIRTGATLGGDNLYPESVGSGYVTNGSEQYFAANVWTTITNYQGVIARNMGTLTSSSLAVNASCWFDLDGYISADPSANGVDFQLAAFTNGIVASNCQDRVYSSATAQYFSMGIGGMLYMTNNSTIMLKLKPNKNTTLTFNHANATLKRQTKD